MKLTNSRGAYVTLSRYGARITGIYVPDREGALANVVFGAPADGKPDPYYAGATVGRVANRISKAQFSIDGITYSLDRNDGANCNHGGLRPLSSKEWSASYSGGGDGHVTFALCSEHGEGGFPGAVCFSVDYEWTDDMRLIITHRAVTDRPTMVSLTNHAYFNLSGRLCPIDNHRLQIMSHTMLEASDDFLPTGKLMSVDGSVFDFSKEKTIGEVLHSGDPRLTASRGLNHCYTLPATEKGDKPKLAARLSDPLSGRLLEVLTDYPGLLLYSAGFFNPPSSAVCLEAQYWPDAPNHREWPQCRLNPGEDYCHHIMFRFGTAG